MPAPSGSSAAIVLLGIFAVFIFAVTVAVLRLLILVHVLRLVHAVILHAVLAVVLLVLHLKTLSRADALKTASPEREILFVFSQTYM